MITEEFTTKLIKSENGMYLTQAADVPIQERIVAEAIALGRYDAESNYKEITAEEADAIKTEQKQFSETSILD